MANRNRRAGHDYERKIKNELTSLVSGSEFRTTREMSRDMDNKGIDLIDINGVAEFSVQCKTLTKFPKLDYLKSFDGKPNIIFWKKTEKKGSRFYPIEEYVIMRKEDFYELYRKRD